MAALYSDQFREEIKSAIWRTYIHTKMVEDTEDPEFVKYTADARKERDEAAPCKKMPSGLTHKEEVIVRWIRRFFLTNTMPPTLTDIANAFGKMKEHMALVLTDLVRIGALYRRRRKYIPVGTIIVFDDKVPFAVKD